MATDEADMGQDKAKVAQEADYGGCLERFGRLLTTHVLFTRIIRACWRGRPLRRARPEGVSAAFF
jgi:hypothetical protein